MSVSVCWCVCVCVCMFVFCLVAALVCRLLSSSSLLSLSPVVVVTLSFRDLFFACFVFGCFPFPRCFRLCAGARVRVSLPLLVWVYLFLRCGRHSCPFVVLVQANPRSSSTAILQTQKTHTRIQIQSSGDLFSLSLFLCTVTLRHRLSV